MTGADGSDGHGWINSGMVSTRFGEFEFANGYPTDSTAAADGTTDIYFGPTMPPGQENNWIETIPGRGWFPIFRFYGPLEPYFDKSWRLADIDKSR